jgi:hypothetical protein
MRRERSTAQRLAVAVELLRSGRGTSGLRAGESNRCFGVRDTTRGGTFADRLRISGIPGLKKAEKGIGKESEGRTGQDSRKSLQSKRE